MIPTHKPLRILSDYFLLKTCRKLGLQKVSPHLPPCFRTLWSSDCLVVLFAPQLRVSTFIGSPPLGYHFSWPGSRPRRSLLLCAFLGQQLHRTSSGIWELGSHLPLSQAFISYVVGTRRPSMGTWRGWLTCWRCLKGIARDSLKHPPRLRCSECSVMAFVAVASCFFPSCLVRLLWLVGRLSDGLHGRSAGWWLIS